MGDSAYNIDLPDHISQQLIQRIDELAFFSESPDNLTRRFATPEHRQVNDLVAQWMRELDMDVSEDAIGNIRGRYEGKISDCKAILLASHLDTVVDAGKYDGMLGVLSALACVQALHENQIRLPYAIEVVGFADEEGVRYHSTFLGSRAMAGTFDVALLDNVDKDGISMANAIEQFGHSVSKLSDAVCSPGDYAAYLELHIEQGPVLEQENIPVGVVTAISGATRLTVELTGVAGHAGTVPMTLRQDALVAASRCILAVQSTCTGDTDLVGTVGMIEASPGAGNVIAGMVEFSVDIRAASDQLRSSVVNSAIAEFKRIAVEEKVGIQLRNTHEAESVQCDTQLISEVGAAIAARGYPVVEMSSGAGHDAAAMADIVPICMIFVRCKAGVSHNPAEFVTPEDAATGAQLMLDSVLRIAFDNTAPPA